MLKSRTTKLTLCYLNFIISYFERINAKFQTEEPLMHKQCRLMMEHCIREFMTMFVKPAAIVAKPLCDVDFKSAYNIKHNNNVFVGQEVKDYLESTNLPDSRVKEFYGAVKRFLSVAVKYLLKNLPLSGPMLKNAEVADVNMQRSASCASFLFYLKRFPSILPRYATTDDRVAELSGARKYKYLPQVLCAILSIPHSNAACERLFSYVGKNCTDFRSSMSINTFQSLLVLKQSAGPCYANQYSPDLLK